MRRKENQFLRERIKALEADCTERKERQAWLEGIIERQMAQLPPPDWRGVITRLVDWVRNS